MIIYIPKARLNAHSKNVLPLRANAKDFYKIEVAEDFSMVGKRYDPKSDKFVADDEVDRKRFKIEKDDAITLIDQHIKNTRELLELADTQTDNTAYTNKLRTLLLQKQKLLDSTFETCLSQ